MLLQYRSLVQKLQRDQSHPALEASDTSQALPLFPIHLNESDQLQHHAQAQLTKPGVVVADELKNLRAQSLRDTIHLKHRRSNHLDSHQVVTRGLHAQIQVDATRDHGSEVLGIHVVLIDQRIKIIVGDEDDLSTKIKAGRQLLSVIRLHVRLSAPAEGASASHVRRSLQQVQRHAILKHAIRVIEDHHRVTLAVLKQNLVQPGGTDETLHDGDLITRRSVPISNLHHTIRLTQPRRTREDQGLVMTRHRGSCHLVHCSKTLHQTGMNLRKAFFLLRGNQSRLGH